MNDKKYYSMTIPQRILLASQSYTFEPKKVQEFNAISWFFTVKTDCDVDALKKAFNHLILENDALRTRFKVSFSGGIQQYFHPFESEDLEVIDIGSVDNLEAKMREYQESMKIPRAVLGKALYRAVIFSHGDGATLFVKVSHYCFDGYSIGLAVKRLIGYYELIVDGQELNEANPKLSVEKFVSDNERYQNSERHKNNKKYWANKFKQLKEYSLPIPRRKFNGEAATETLIVDGDRYIQMQKFCMDAQVSMPFLAVTLMSLTIYKLTGKRLFSIAHITHGRMNVTQKQVIGCMMNTFPVFYDIKPEQDIKEFLHKTYMGYMDSFLHGTITPVECLLASLGTAIRNHDPNYYALMVSTLSMGNIDVDKEKYSYGGIPHNNLPHQLYCSISNNENGRLGIMIDYQKKRFTPSQIEKMVDTYIGILDRMVSDETTLIRDIFA